MIKMAGRGKCKREREKERDKCRMKGEKQANIWGVKKEDCEGVMCI